VQYMFLIYVDEQAAARRSPADIAAAVAMHAPYIETLKRNAQLVAGERLGPLRSARTLRTSTGKPVVTEGPFAESREQFGGYYLIDAANLDQAIDAAAQCPALKTVALGIEIRPLAAGAMTIDAAGGGHLLALSRPEDVEVGDWSAWFEQLRASGQLASAAPFAPSSSATSLRLREGRVALTDGPFLPGPRQLAGCCVVRTPDVEEALRLAAQWPVGPDAAIEIRSIATSGG
jgi:hypothetical protein